MVTNYDTEVLLVHRKKKHGICKTDSKQSFDVVSPSCGCLTAILAQFFAVLFCLLWCYGTMTMFLLLLFGVPGASLLHVSRALMSCLVVKTRYSCNYSQICTAVSRYTRISGLCYVHRAVVCCEWWPCSGTNSYGCGFMRAVEVALEQRCRRSAGVTAVRAQWSCSTAVSIL